MCSCTLTYTDHNTTVCTQCGVEQNVAFNCTSETVGYRTSHHATFNQGYSRTRRFMQMVESLFFPTPTSLDEHMLEYLAGHKIKTREQLDSLIRASPVKNKRYCSLHLFCRLHLPDYTPPVKRNFLLIMKAMEFQFEKLSTKHALLFPNKPFINYGFMLIYMLCAFGLYEYITYVKPLKCEKRIACYTERLEVMRSYTGGVTRGVPLESGEQLSECAVGHLSHRVQRDLS